VLLGIRSPHPSPALSSKTWTSTALIVPSGCAIAVIPTKVLPFISDIAPFVTATTGAPSLSLTVVSLPLRVWIACDRETVSVRDRFRRPAL
jgi:hypothetical protein